MKKLVLHVGMNKTATTSIQFSLKGFENETVLYSQVGAPRPNHSVAMQTMFGDAAHTYYAKRQITDEKLTALRQTYLDQLEQELKDDHPVLVISGEDISKMTVSEIAAMKSYFDQYCDSYHVIAYVRDPIGYRVSSFQQTVKGGAAKTLQLRNPNYRERFEKFIDIFGREAVELVPFDRKAFRDGCIITDFCDRVGIDIAQVDKTTKNEGVSVPAVGALLVWNAQYPARLRNANQAQSRKKTISDLVKLFPGKFSLGPEISRRGLDLEDIAWMEKTVGVSLLPADDAPRKPGVETNEELGVVAQEIVPQLTAHLQEHGITPPESDNAAALVEALFQHHLKTLRQASRPRAGRKNKQAGRKAANRARP